MQSTRQRSDLDPSEIRDRIAMFPQEGGTSCDHRVTAIALVTIAALTSFLFFSAAVGVGLSLISAGLVVWVLSDHCSKTDWSKCGETAIDLLALFAEAGNSSTQEGRYDRGRRVRIESPPSPTLNPYGHNSRRTWDRNEASPPRSFGLEKGSRVPVDNETPFPSQYSGSKPIIAAPESERRERVPTSNMPQSLTPSKGSQQVKMPSGALQTQGARVSLSSTETPSAAPSNRSISIAPESERGPRVLTPNAPPSLTPSQGSQQVKMPSVGLQTQGARVPLSSTETPSAASSNRPISITPESERGPRVSTPNAPAALAPPPGSQLVKGPALGSQPQAARVPTPNAPPPLDPGLGLRVTSAGTNHTDIAARVGVGGGVSPNILPLLVSKIPSTREPLGG